MGCQDPHLRETGGINIKNLMIIVKQGGQMVSEGEFKILGEDRGGHPVVPHLMDVITIVCREMPGS